MNIEEKKSLGVDLIKEGISPFSGKRSNWRSKRWWKKKKDLHKYAEVEHENEYYVEYVVRYVISKEPDKRAKAREEDALIEKRKQNLAKIKS